MSTLSKINSYVKYINLMLFTVAMLIAVSIFMIELRRQESNLSKSIFWFPKAKQKPKEVESIKWSFRIKSAVVIKF